CGSALLETHRLLRDQVDRRDPRSPRLDPADGLDRDAMLALPRRQEQDELVRPELILKGGHQGDRGLADAGRRVGEEVPAVRDREASVREEVGLALAHSIERPWNPEGARGPRDGCHERFQDRPPQGRRRPTPGPYEGLPEGEGRKYSGGFRPEIITKQRLSAPGELLRVCGADASSGGSGTSPRSSGSPCRRARSDWACTTRSLGRCCWRTACRGRHAR